MLGDCISMVSEMQLAIDDAVASNKQPSMSFDREVNDDSSGPKDENDADENYVVPCLVDLAKEASSDLSVVSDSSGSADPTPSVGSSSELPPPTTFTMFQLLWQLILLLPFFSFPSPSSSPSPLQSSGPEAVTIQPDSSSSSTPLTCTMASSTHYETAKRGSEGQESLAKSCECQSIPETKDKKLKKKVQFGTIEWRMYPIVLGDNPSVSNGPPLSLGWHYYYSSDEATSTNSVVQYEDFVRPHQHRRYGEALRLSWLERLQLLQSAMVIDDPNNVDDVVTNDEIMDCMSQVRLIQHQRQQTIKRLHLEPIELFAQSLKRKCYRRIFSHSSQHERQSLQ